MSVKSHEGNKACRHEPVATSPAKFEVQPNKIEFKKLKGEWVCAKCRRYLKPQWYIDERPR